MLDEAVPYDLETASLTAMPVDINSKAVIKC